MRASAFRNSPLNGKREKQWAYADGGPATSATLTAPEGVFLDGSGNLFISDQQRIRGVDSATQIITTVAGSANRGFTGDGGLATNAELDGRAGDRRVLAVPSESAARQAAIPARRSGFRRLGHRKLLLLSRKKIFRYKAVARKISSR